MSNKVLQETHAYMCLACGKCTGSCPVAPFKKGFSPRMVIEKFLLNPERIYASPDLWGCLTCSTCHEKCNLDVNFPEFLRNVRIEAFAQGKKAEETHGGVLHSVMKMMTNEELKQNRLGWLPSGAQIVEKGEYLYFTGCLPYFDTIFEELNPQAGSVASRTVRLLNKAGIKPVVLKDERCCGHDLIWSGDEQNFLKLARINKQLIEESGAKYVITTCPEGTRTLKLDYPKYLGKLNFKVMHITELIIELLEKKALQFKEVNKKITYHDACRLGKHLGLYDMPRKVFQAIPALQLIEMPRNKANAVCCGTSCWINCSSCSKALQLNRLKEAKETGADYLVTSCIKCLIHYLCALEDKILKEEEKIKVIDFSQLLEEAQA